MRRLWRWLVGLWLGAEGVIARQDREAAPLQREIEMQKARGVVLEGKLDAERALADDLYAALERRWDADAVERAKARYREARKGPS